MRQRRRRLGVAPFAAGRIVNERVEPEWAMVTILFVDIRGFTSYADRTTASQAVEFLNEFFEVVVPVVSSHDGWVRQLLGDGLLAVFGAGGHADAALGAGRAMLAAVESRFGERCRIGVGLNSGLVLRGTIGTDEHTEVAVIGDPVNVAARVQDATRDLGEPLLLSEATRLLLDTDHPELEPRGSVSLKGKPVPIVVYGLAPGSVTVGRSGRRTEVG
jgi:adenylate cyclase